MTREKGMYVQFVEDTLSTVNSFRKAGRVVYRSHPESGKGYVVDV